MEFEVPFSPVPPKRDADLIAILPAIDAEYDFDRLSAVETLALTAALSDGFHDFGADRDTPPLPTPTTIDSGLLKHSFLARRGSDYDPVENSSDFWSSVSDSPPAWEFFPLEFRLSRLRLYFSNQLNRFSTHLKLREPLLASTELRLIEEIAGERLYKKPWYEFHALQFLDWIEDAEAKCNNDRLRPLGIITLSSFSGQLGRLVEQYYWRLRFEDATKTGVSARMGASEGGKARAQKRAIELAGWQCSADEIWKSKPQLTAMAVAELIKAKRKLKPTAKNIARFLKRP